MRNIYVQLTMVPDLAPVIIYDLDSNFSLKIVNGQPVRIPINFNLSDVSVLAGRCNKRSVQAIARELR